MMTPIPRPNAADDEDDEDAHDRSHLSHLMIVDQFKVAELIAAGTARARGARPGVARRS